MIPSTPLLADKDAGSEDDPPDDEHAPMTRAITRMSGATSPAFDVATLMILSRPDSAGHGIAIE